jgi:hypothetical protein
MCQKAYFSRVEIENFPERPWCRRRGSGTRGCKRWPRAYNLCTFRDGGVSLVHENMIMGASSVCTAKLGAQASGLQA